MIYLKQDILEVASWTGMGVDARDQHILIGIQATVDGLQLFNNLCTKEGGVQHENSSRMQGGTESMFL